MLLELEENKAVGTPPISAWPLLWAFLNLQIQASYAINSPRASSTPVFSPAPEGAFRYKQEPRGDNI